MFTVNPYEANSRDSVLVICTNARFLRPLDKDLIHPLARRIGKVVTMEEGALPGGFGSAVIESFTDENLLIPTFRIGIPDQLVDHASPKQSKESLGLTPQQMVERIKKHFSFNISVSSSSPNTSNPVTTI